MNCCRKNFQDFLHFFSLHFSSLKFVAIRFDFGEGKKENKWKFGPRKLRLRSAAKIKTWKKLKRGAVRARSALLAASFLHPKKLAPRRKSTASPVRTGEAPESRSVADYFSVISRMVLLPMISRNSARFIAPWRI